MGIVESAHFEGPEKKLKVTFVQGTPGLRALPRAVWDEVLGAAGAAIVSAAHDESWDAYVLSESSLFVSDHSLTLITCGQTRLVDAVLPLLTHVPRASLSQLLYARKSEHFPQHQASTFDADALALSALLGSAGPCERRRLGHGEHFVDLFDHAATGLARRPDVTLEVLMHGPSAAACARFERDQAPAAHALVASLAPGFQLHEHYFEPQGYSVNGLFDGAYVTLHVTPEPVGSYVSFELQGPPDAVASLDAQRCVVQLAAAFAPRSIEVLAYHPTRTWLTASELSASIPGYAVQSSEPLRAADYHLAFTQLRPSTAS
jgi:S-adenosylmethionine decarboxylase